GGRVPDADLAGVGLVVGGVAADDRGDGAAVGVERGGAAGAVLGVVERHEVGVEQPEQVVPLPAAAVLLVGGRRALGEALHGADDVVDAPLELALGDAAEVQGDLGALALLDRLAAGVLGLEALRLLVELFRQGGVAGPGRLLPLPGNAREA